MAIAVGRASAKDSVTTRALIGKFSRGFLFINFVLLKRKKDLVR